MAQPSSYQRVGATAADYDASAGPTFILFDGVDDSLASATFAAGTLTSSMDCLMAVRRDIGSAVNMVIGPYDLSIGAYIGSANYGSAFPAAYDAGTPAILVNGVQLAGGTSVTSGTLYAAITIGQWNIFELRNLDLSNWTRLGIGGYPGFRLNGALSPIQLFASGQDANRDLARAQMAEYFGVTLP